MADRSSITFVGPVFTRPGPNRTMQYCFTVLQAPDSSVELSYGTLGEAKHSRSQLVALPHTHSVPNRKLLEAIQEAMQQASEASPQPVDAVLAEGLAEMGEPKLIPPGKIACGQCEGTGTIEGGLSGDSPDEECPVCDGKGEIDCDHCDGVGYVPKQHDTGAEPCPQCNGG